MQIKLRDLAIFDAVERTGSIQGAAAAMGLTQSAVTRVVQRLELDLGHALLDRSQRPIVLTADGRRAITHVREVLAAAGRMEAAFQGDEVPPGAFRLGLPHALTPLLVDADDLLGLRAYPQLRAAFVSGWSNEILAGLRDSSLDAAITLSQTEDDTGTATTLSQGMLCVMAHPSKVEAAIDLTRANDIGWALNPSGCGYRRALLSALEAQDMNANIVLETNSLELQLAFVRAGRALTLGPDFLQTLLPDATNLRFVLSPMLQTQISVLFHPGARAGPLDPVLSQIAERVRSRLSGIPK